VSLLGVIFHERLQAQYTLLGLGVDFILRVFGGGEAFTLTSYA